MPAIRIERAAAFVVSDELAESYRRARVLEACGDDREPSPHSESGAWTAEYYALLHKIHLACGLDPWNPHVLIVRPDDTREFARPSLAWKAAIERSLKEKRQRARQKLA